MVEGLALGLVLAAFAGGAFGAAIGALPAFAITGVLVIVGEMLAIARAELAGLPATGVDVTGALAFGPAFGPHVSFGGGAAAAAYAARRGYIDPPTAHHPAKYITGGLGSRPDVLLVGGLFGVLGHLVLVGSDAGSVPWDPVAFGVVASAFAHRLAFGYSLVGRPVGRWLDMSPFERGERRPDGTAGTAPPAPDVTADGGSTETDGCDGRDGRLAVEPWLDYQYRWSHVAMLGLVMGMLGAYVAYRTGSAFLAFGLSAAALAFLCAGVDRVPVTHHMTLPASTVVIAAVPAAAEGATPPILAEGLGLPVALLLGGAIGVLGALLGELVQRVCYAHAETHLDPPAASIVLTTLVIGALAMAGLLPHAGWIPLP